MAEASVVTHVSVRSIINGKSLNILITLSPIFNGYYSFLYS